MHSHNIGDNKHAEVVDQCCLLIEQGKFSEEIDLYLGSLSLTQEEQARVVYEIQDFQVEVLKKKQMKSNAHTYLMLGGAIIFVSLFASILSLVMSVNMNYWFIVFPIGGWAMVQKGRKELAAIDQYSPMVKRRIRNGKRDEGYETL